jgi:hypothetical protein
MKFDQIKWIDTSAEKGNNAIQAYIKFKDSDFKMSVVRFAGSYGFELHRYEIGIFKNDAMVSYPPITHEGDTVRGWVKPHQIEQYINKMAKMLDTEPYQD